MFWLLIGMAVDGLMTTAVGIVLSLTIAYPIVPHIPTNALHPVAALRTAVPHWDHRG
jgi:hypothetical protein